MICDLCHKAKRGKLNRLLCNPCAEMVQRISVVVARSPEVREAVLNRTQAEAFETAPLRVYETDIHSAARMAKK